MAPVATSTFTPPGEVRILTPNAMLGYGYQTKDFWRGVQEYHPHAIILDSGSTDGGPYKLGLGKMTCARSSYQRDLTPILQACFHHKIKVLIGSAGGSGSNRHVDELVEIIDEICQSEKISLKVAKIYAQVERETVKECIRNKTVTPCGPVPELTEKDVDNVVKGQEIVAQMGAEPYIRVLERSSEVDVIIGGRSYDPAPFAAFAMHNGISPGAAWHCGKIMECGGMCAIPKGRTMLATLKEDKFDLMPLSLNERCTKLSVAAHTLYEKTRPDILPGPGGRLLLKNAKYTELQDGRSVRVEGAIFEPLPYTIKLEGAEQVGFRTIFIGGIRDPTLIEQIDSFLKAVYDYTVDLFPSLLKEDCQLLWHVYGKNAVMGPLETFKGAQPHELGVMGEVVAPTQELADSIASAARTSCLHMPYEGQLATTGNFASPLTPLDQPIGPVFKFSIYHLIPCNDPSSWPVTITNVGVRENEAVHSISRSTPRTTDSKPNGTYLPKVQKTINLNKTNAIHDLASVVRSKNSGPFEITLDIMFTDESVYQRVRQANVLNAEMVMKLYKTEKSSILWEGFFDAALAWKCTIKRPWPQGTIGERDTLGTAQHAPLLDIIVPPLSL
ncbi:hypothetical protein L7F22_067888 [Adiantum nelumboides]|nr:hypothetical protein [Adiantum nelumboides]